MINYIRKVVTLRIFRWPAPSSLVHNGNPVIVSTICIQCSSWVYTLLLVNYRPPTSNSNEH